ncbi:MAG: hypothetical protein ABW024_07060 [Microbacterium sp.]
MESVRCGAVVVAWTDAGSDERATRRAAGDALLARLVGELGFTAAIGRRCPVCGADDHGRPVTTAPVALSLSYAGSMVAGAAVRLEDAASVGIDIEPSDRDTGDLRALFAPATPPDIAGWTRIEAVLKADGRGIRIEPSSVVIDGSVATRPGPFDVRTIPGPAGFVISCAVAAPSPR